MFQKISLLQASSDQALHLQPSQPYHFAQGEMLMPVVSAEATHIAREYPLVFVDGEKAQLCALLGLKPGVNAHVLPSGRWQGRYVPSRVRSYPFALVDISKDSSTAEKTMAIAVEREAPHLNTEAQGEALFADGKPTAVLQRVQKTLTHLHQEAQRTGYQVALLKELGLLQSQTLVVKSPKGKALEMKGLLVVEHQRFGQLDAQQLHQLHACGALQLVHAHLMSLTNLEDGWLAHALDHAQQAQQPSAPVSPEAFGDTLKFS